MVRIESLLPNPVGKDEGAEWIRILGGETDAESLQGWWLEDSSGHTFYLSGLGKIGPGERLELRETGVSLNNNGDKISLYDESGTRVDQLEYSGSVAEGEIIFGEGVLPPSAPPAGGQVGLADVSKSGILREGLAGGSIVQLLLSGVVVAALVAVGFVYIWKALFKENEPNDNLRNS
jgi:hypothetical protein